MNKTSDYKLTIVIPVYNEEENIFNLEKRISGYILNNAHFKSCALFVNDGSTDNGMEFIKQVCERNSDFYYLNFETNRGLSAAIKAGIDYTFSPYVGYIDADLQTDPDDFALLSPHVTENALVMGIRVNRKDSFVKSISSKIANSFRRFMTKDGVEDTGCPLKIIDINYAKRLPLFTGMHRFLPALILLQNGKIKQVPVRHYPRTAGESKFNLSNRLIGPLMDTFAYRWMKKRYINYKVESSNL